MSAVRMRLRSELRARWRSWLGLALLIGLAGAAAVAAAAGARRTETAYPRFVQAQNGYDLITGGSSGNIDPARALAQIEALPEVAQWARIDMAASTAILPSGRVAPAPELMAVTDLRGRAGFRLNRFKVISGRMVSLRAPGEAMIDFPTADREGLRVGSVIRFIVGDPNAKRPRLAAVHIVGIVASPGQFPAVGASSASGSVYVTPAFVLSNGIRPSPGDAGLLIRLRRGAAGRAGVPAADAGRGPGWRRHPRSAAGADRRDPAVDPAGVPGAVGALRSHRAGGVCRRGAVAGPADLPGLGRSSVLWALGFSRAQLFSLGMARAAIIGTASACVVVPVAVLLSPLDPGRPGQDRRARPWIRRGRLAAGSRRGLGRCPDHAGLRRPGVDRRASGDGRAGRPRAGPQAIPGVHARAVAGLALARPRPPGSGWRCSPAGAGPRSRSGRRSSAPPSASPP